MHKHNASHHRAAVLLIIPNNAANLSNYLLNILALESIRKTPVIGTVTDRQWVFTMEGQIF